jgi:hypothetical protein
MLPRKFECARNVPWLNMLINNGTLRVAVGTVSGEKEYIAGFTVKHAVNTWLHFIALIVYLNFNKSVLEYNLLC